MKRSKINACIKEMEELIHEYKFALPFFCSVEPEEWKERGAEYQEIRDNMLGWDVTDYGMGDWDKTGFALITLRNGNQKIEKYTKTYAEKLLMLKEGQYAPMHFHWNKMEDIINRGGGNILITVYKSLPNEEMDMESDVVVSMDGREFTVKAGTQVKLKPGDSITIYPYMYHDFNVEAGTGTVLLGEVSMCNDDANDNRFHSAKTRFSEIEEDEAPYRLLCNEYDTFFK